jgi:predicted transcriptional regulator
MPVREVQGLADLSGPQRRTGDSRISQSKVLLFDVVKELPVPIETLCENKTTNRYYVSGTHNGKTVIEHLVTQIELLPRGHTLGVDLSQVCATGDFVDIVVSSLFFGDSPFRPLVKGKQIVFLDPDDTTNLSICHAFGNRGQINSNCMVARRMGDIPTTLWVIGHIEPHIQQVLDYVRSSKDVTLHDLIKDGISRSIGNASGRMREVWEMGLVRRDKGVDKESGRSVFVYSAYHPILDWGDIQYIDQDDLFTTIDKYNQYCPPHLLRRKDR